MSDTPRRHATHQPATPLEPHTPPRDDPRPASNPRRVVGEGFSALLGMEQSEADGPVDVNDPTFTPPARGDAEAGSRMWMTAMKMFRPIFSAVVQAPVEQLEPQDLMATFFVLLKGTNRVAERVAHHLQESGLVDLSVTDDRWILRRVIPHVAQSVAEQWRTHGQVDDATLERLYQTLIQALARDDLRATPPALELDGTILEACAVEDRYLRLSAPEAMKVSFLNAMQPLVAEVSQFSCWHSPDALVVSLAQIVTENAEYLYRQQAEAMMSDRGRAVLLQATLKHAGHQVQESYAIHATALLAHYEGLADKEQERFRTEQAGPAARHKLCQSVADDARARCALLHQAAQAGAESLDVLLREVRPAQPVQDIQL